jgi:hypothetical protein
MENIQAEELREKVQECCPNIFDKENTVSGLDTKACCGIPPIILENTTAPSKDSFESINQKTSLVKRALRRVKELKLRNIYHILGGNNKNNVNQSALVPHADTLTQFTNIYPLFYKM